MDGEVLAEEEWNKEQQNGQKREADLELIYLPHLALE